MIGLPSTDTRPARVSSRTGAATKLARRVACGAPQQRPQPRQDFLHMKGLGDVIVGAGVEALHLVAPTIARGQDQDRHGAAGPAPFLENGDAVLLRQAEVEHDRVIGFGVAEKTSPSSPSKARSTT